MANNTTDIILTNSHNYWVKLLGHAATVLLTIVISMTGFWMMIGRDLTTRDEVHKIVNEKTSYVTQRLEDHTSQEDKLERVIEKNTEAIQALQIQLATLNKTLELIDRDHGKLRLEHD